MKFYRITIQNNFNKIKTYNNDLEGFDITPKNHIKYEGIVVSKIIVINRFFIESILKKKIKRKLELYLQFIIDYIDDEGDNGGSINEILNDIKRYKSILMYKYSKYLEQKYIDMLNKKLELIEKELALKIYINEQKNMEFDQENMIHRTR